MQSEFGGGCRKSRPRDSNSSANMATGHSDSGVPNALHMSLRSSIRPVGSIKDAGSRMNKESRKDMGKVILQEPLKSIHGQLLTSDPYYFRIYPVSKDGEFVQIVQACPDRSRYKPTAKHLAAMAAFGERFGRQKHEEYLKRVWQGQLEINFNN